MSVRLASAHALDNAQIAVDGVAEHAQCLLVFGTVMCGDGLRDAVEFCEDDALVEPTFIHPRGQTAYQEATTRRFQCRGSQPGIRNESLLITYRAVSGNPICLGHGSFPCWCVSTAVSTTCVVSSGA